VKAASQSTSRPRADHRTASRHVYLRLPKDRLVEVASVLKGRVRVVDFGDRTEASSHDGWIEVAFPEKLSVPLVREKLVSWGLSDLVVRVDLLKGLGAGREQSKQLDLFAGLS